MPWTKVAPADELAPSQMKRVEIGSKRLLLINAEGKHYCVDEMCSHEDYSLWFGCVKGKSIKCSLHGSYFNLENGQPLCEPADCPLRTYPTKVKEDQVWVETE